MNKFLSRLFPERLQPVQALPNEERLKLFATVGDHDNCLRAVTDGLMESLAVEFLRAIQDTATDVEKLRAIEGMRAAYYMLQGIEKERDQAKAWRKKMEQQQT